MKKLKLIGAICALVCAGCQEYTANYPLGEPISYARDYAIIGEWQFVSAQNLDTREDLKFGSHYLRVRKFNNLEYLVQLVGDTLESIRDIDHFRVYAVKLDKQLVASASPIDDPEKVVFTAYKFELQGDTLSIRGISEETYKAQNVVINSTQAHRAFIQSVWDRDEIWSRQYFYVRK